jgi:sugar fermentation stimulation protein A
MADRADKKCAKIFIEVKGCTLARHGIALFPDAPTSRGARHLEELMEAKRQGFGAAILVLVFRQDAGLFSPNEQTDPRFAELFRRAVSCGVECYPVKIAYNAETEQALYVESLPFKA